MTIGLTIISNQLQPYGETLFVMFAKLFMGKNKSLDIVIYKNLQSHKKRNVMTALMLALSTTFIIFSGSGISTQAGGILQQMKSFFGSDITISSLLNEKLVLDEYHISNYLQEFNRTKPGIIKSWSFASWPLGNFPGVSKIDIMPLSMFPKIKANIIGVDSNIMDSVYHDYY